MGMWIVSVSAIVNSAVMTGRVHVIFFFNWSILWVYAQEWDC